MPHCLLRLRAVAVVLVSVCVVSLASAEAGAASTGTLFGQRYIDFTDPGLTTKWRAAAEAVARDSDALEACLSGGLCAGAGVRAWRDLIRQAEADSRGPLAAVQALIDDRIRFMGDGGGEGDVWSSPLQTLLRGAGDCEDIAILKLATLRHLGLDMDTMRVVVLKLKNARGLTSPMHAVLLVDTGTGRVVLDNLEQGPLPERRASNYQPLYALSLVTTES